MDKALKKAMYKRYLKITVESPNSFGVDNSKLLAVNFFFEPFEMTKTAKLTQRTFLLT